MGRLTRSQVRRIQKIISEHMEAVSSIVLGDVEPSPRLIKKLHLPRKIEDMITSAYKYGKLSCLKGKNLSNMSEQDVNNLLRNLKLTKSQQYSIEASKIKAQQYLDTLSQKITTSTISMAIQSDLNAWEAVKQVIPAAMGNSTPMSQVVQKLRDMTGDIERDWDRIAHTEMWSAKCQGEVEAIMNGESPFSKDKGDTMVYIRPSKTACNKCKQLYLEKDGVTPRVFSVAELVANGSNYGKKQADWKACVPPLHPNCMCVLNVKPKDTEFDTSGNIIYKYNKS